MLIKLKSYIRKQGEYTIDVSLSLDYIIFYYKLSKD